jgi:hypothetical protein
VPIAYEDEQSNSRSIIYYMPAASTSAGKVFRP